MELKIPCNDDKSDLFPCGKCKYNDWELCDRIKYLRNNWTTGDIFTEPKPTDYRYKINFESFISKDSVDLFKVGMSETTKDTIIANAINNERTEIDIIENTKLIVESK